MKAVFEQFQDGSIITGHGVPRFLADSKHRAASRCSIRLRDDLPILVTLDQVENVVCALAHTVTTVTLLSGLCGNLGFSLPHDHLEGRAVVNPDFSSIQSDYLLSL